MSATEKWSAGQWLVAVESYNSWNMTSIRKGELYLIERANSRSMTVAGLNWGNGHPLFRLATADEVAAKLAAVYRRLDEQLGQGITSARDAWYGVIPGFCTTRDAYGQPLMSDEVGL